MPSGNASPRRNGTRGRRGPKMSYGADQDEELAELQRRFAVLEDEARATVEKTMSSPRTTNRTQRERVAAANVRADNDQELAKLDEQITQLRRKHDDLAHANLEKRRELDKLNDRLQDLSREASLPPPEDNPIMKEIRELEVRLQKAVTKYEDAQEVRRTYEQIVKRLGGAHRLQQPARSARVDDARKGGRLRGAVADVARCQPVQGAGQAGVAPSPHPRASHAPVLFLRSPQPPPSHTPPTSLPKSPPNPRAQLRRRPTPTRVCVRRRAPARRRSWPSSSRWCRRSASYARRADRAARARGEEAGDQRRARAPREGAARRDGDAARPTAARDGERGARPATTTGAAHAITEADIEEEQEKIASYEAAFREIKEATGVADVNEVIQKFITQEETHKSLLAMTRESQTKIEQLSESKVAAQERVQKLKYAAGGEQQQSAGQAADQAERNKLERQRHKHERLARVMIAVKAGVQHLSERLEGVKLEGQTPLVLTDDNMVEVLQQCEAKMRIVLEAIRQEEEALLRDMGEAALQTSTELPTEPPIVNNNRVRDAEGGEEAPSEEEFEEDLEEEVVEREALKKQSGTILDKATKKTKKRGRKKAAD